MVFFKTLAVIASVASLTQCTPYSKREAGASPEAYPAAYPDAYAEAFAEPYLLFPRGSLLTNPLKHTSSKSKLHDSPNKQETPMHHYAQIAKGLGNFMSKPHPLDGVGHALEACIEQQLGGKRGKAPTARQDAHTQDPTPATPGHGGVNAAGTFIQHLGQMAQGVGNFMSKPYSIENLMHAIEICVKQQVQGKTKTSRDVSSFSVDIARRDFPAPPPVPDSTSPPPDTNPASAPPSPIPSSLGSELHNLLHKVTNNSLAIPIITEAFDKLEPLLQKYMKALLKTAPEAEKVIPEVAEVAAKVVRRDAYASPYAESFAYAFPESNIYARDAEPEPEPLSDMSSDIYARDAFAFAFAEPDPYPEADPESDPEPYEAHLSDLYARDAEPEPEPEAHYWNMSPSMYSGARRLHKGVRKFNSNKKIYHVGQRGGASQASQGRQGGGGIGKYDGFEYRDFKDGEGF